MATATDRLIALKNEIQKAKLDKSACEGALKQNLSRLKDEFQCRSLEQAQAKLEKLKTQKESLQGQIEQTVERLEADYEW